MLVSCPDDCMSYTLFLFMYSLQLRILNACLREFSFIVPDRHCGMDDIFLSVFHFSVKTSVAK